MTVRHEAGEKRNFFPSLCNIIGTLLFVLVIAAFLPMTVPKFLGYEVYDVISGSMEPEIPVGSAVYIEAVEPEMLSEGEVIAFQREDSVITHRVLENRSDNKEFITKGDANDKEDMLPVPYYDLIGKVKFHIPVIGALMAFLSDGSGKICAAFVIIWGIILHLVSNILRSRESKT